MSYDPKGKSFTYDGVRYCLGIAQDELGINVCALFYQSGGAWFAKLPVIHDGLTDMDVMAHGSVSAFIASLLPKASEMLRGNTTPEKPAQEDKAKCVAYDLALDVDFDHSTGEFKINKTPPLSHAR